MKYSILISAFFLVSITQKLFAQSDFREGYIITNESDTIYGLIDYRGSSKNSRVCTFKDDENSDPVTLSPLDLLAYRYINSKYYVSKKLVIEKIEIPLFLEYLINGVVDIYYYYDRGQDYYLIDNKDGNGIKELKNEDREIVINNQRYTRESKEYIGLLNYSFRESPTVSNKIDNLILDHKSLINIAKDYHEEVCENEECIIYEKTEKKGRIGFGVLLGVAAQKFSILISKDQFWDPIKNPYYLPDTEFDVGFCPSFGIYFNNRPFKRNERWDWRFEVFYQIRKTTAHAEYNTGGYVSTITNNMKMTQNVFDFSTLISYKVPMGKIKALFQVGLFYEHIFMKDFIREEIHYTTDGDIFSAETFYDNPFGSQYTGFIIGTGLTFNLYKDKEASVSLNYHGGFTVVGYEMMSNTFLLNFGIPIF